MSLKGVLITDKVVLEQIGGELDLENDIWKIPPAAH
jgi:hypothetical protein